MKKKNKILVLADKKEALSKLISLLSEHSEHIFVASNSMEMRHSAWRDYFHLIVITDSLDKHMTKDIIMDIRHFCPHAKILCLFENITEDIEEMLRGIGIVYLGSYKTFNELAYKIIPAAINPQISAI